VEGRMEIVNKMIAILIYIIVVKQGFRSTYLPGGVRQFKLNQK